MLKIPFSSKELRGFSTLAHLRTAIPITKHTKSAFSIESIPWGSFKRSWFKSQLFPDFTTDHSTSLPEHDPISAKSLFFPASMEGPVGLPVV